VARVKEQVGHALQVLTRPPAAARSISHASYASSGSSASAASAGPTDAAPLNTLGGGGRAGKLRGSQRQLAAKLASRLRSGSASSSQAGGSQAGGSLAGDRPRGQRSVDADVDSGSDGEGARDTQVGGALDRRAPPNAAAAARHGAWLSTQTREELTKMNKAAAGGQLLGGGTGGGSGGGAGALSVQSGGSLITATGAAPRAEAGKPL
jgi:hypothetical protein